MLSVPAPTRVPIGVATVGGQRVELFVSPEWARYLDSLNSQVVVTSNAVGLPGAPGTTGAAGFGMCMDGEGSSDDFIPGPKGEAGAQGGAGPALFMLQECGADAEALPVQPTQINESFIAPTLLNSWANFGAPYNPIGYYKDAGGIVHLRGMIKNGASPFTICTLPAGYRPVNQEAFTVVANNAFGRVDVLSSGDVLFQAGSNPFVSLDGITFRAAGTF